MKLILMVLVLFILACQPGKKRFG